MITLMIYSVITYFSLNKLHKLINYKYSKMMICRMIWIKKENLIKLNKCIDNPVMVYFNKIKFIIKALVFKITI